MNVAELFVVLNVVKNNKNMSKENIICPNCERSVCACKKRVSASGVVGCIYCINNQTSAPSNARVIKTNSGGAVKYVIKGVKQH